jgi:hypothetical protein
VEFAIIGMVAMVVPAVFDRAGVRRLQHAEKTRAAPG